MTSIKDFASRAPYTADDLVAIVQELLPRYPNQVFTKRTMRFYIAQGVVHRPLGSPKFARYSYEHLLQLLATRMLQDQGYKLEYISKYNNDFWDGDTKKVEADLDKWLVRVRSATMTVKERRREYGGKSMLLPGQEDVSRVRLTEDVVLELRPLDQRREQLERALKRLMEMVSATPADA